MFAHPRPRPRKSALVPPPKRRKTKPEIEEISFDFAARSEYLTGFHKRKVLRSKKAIEEAKIKEREEKVLMRKQLREERKQDLQAHVDAVNALLEESKHIPGPEEDGHGLSGPEDSDDEEWQGFGDEAIRERLDREEEYVDDDRYTTVTVEEVNVTKEGLARTAVEARGDTERSGDAEKHKGTGGQGEKAKGKKIWPKKVKKKFRYETKTDRKTARAKQAAGNRTKAEARVSKSS